jgi:hypothetical protein
MGNTMDVVAEFVTEEMRESIILGLLVEKIMSVDRSIYRKTEDLYYYYKNIRDPTLPEHFTYLYKFQYYNTRMLALKNDGKVIHRAYRSAMINYIFKWYSNSKC